MMTIRLRIISGEDEDFFREIEISGEATFLDLHNFIQELLNFDQGQIASFFMTDEEWQKNEEITLMDMAMDESQESFIMSDTPLKQLIEKEKQRLIYVFDFFNERNLFLEASEINNASCLKPNCIGSQGEAPEQLDLSNMLNESMGEPSIGKDTEIDLDDEMYGLSDDDFNDPMITYTDDLDDF